ncbi:MAG: helix-turn-helix transcriptional regulator [Pseudomonadota bacterium]
MPDFCLIPGAYIRKRREAAGLSIADVAARFVTTPESSELDRIHWLTQIEAGILPATFATLTALRAMFRFDWDVLEHLEAITTGRNCPPPQLCRVCACSEYDACLEQSGRTCAWAEPDLCTACAHPGCIDNAASAPRPSNDPPAIAAGAAA